jgi:hypothetical protein
MREFTRACVFHPQFRHFIVCDPADNPFENRPSRSRSHCALRSRFVESKHGMNVPGFQPTLMIICNRLTRFEVFFLRCLLLRHLCINSAIQVRRLCFTLSLAIKNIGPTDDELKLALNAAHTQLGSFIRVRRRAFLSSLAIKNLSAVQAELVLVPSAAALVLGIASNRSFRREWHPDMARSPMSCVKLRTARSVCSFKSTTVQRPRMEQRRLTPLMLETPILKLTPILPSEPRLSRARWSEQGSLGRRPVPPASGTAYMRCCRNDAR